MESFVWLVSSLNPLHIIAKFSILDACGGPAYGSGLNLLILNNTDHFACKPFVKEKLYILFKTFETTEGSCTGKYPL